MKRKEAKLKPVIKASDDEPTNKKADDSYYGKLLKNPIKPVKIGETNEISFN